MLEIREELPPLGKEGKGSEAIRSHLRRRKLYQQIKEEAKKIRSGMCALFFPP